MSGPLSLCACLLAASCLSAQESGTLDTVISTPSLKAYQSSVYANNRKDYGNAAKLMSTGPVPDLAFHTQLQQNPYWYVDLGQVYTLSKIVVKNRAILAERANGLQLWIGPDGPNAPAPPTPTLVKGFQVPPSFKAYTFTWGGANGPAPKARYVCLRLPGTNYLHLNSIQIYGHSAQADMAAPTGNMPAGAEDPPSF